MISQKMQELVKNNSVIRQMFEEGKILKEKYGEKNVFDFSLGNPSVKAPEKINSTIANLAKEMNSIDLHGYMSNAGFSDVRLEIAKNLNSKFETNFDENNIVMTVGAAAGLNIVLKSILNPDDEVIVFAPYFMEYNNYIKNYDGKVTVISPNFENNFLPNLEEFEAKITSKTKAVITNSPNNPTGIIYDKETISKIGSILDKKQAEFKSQIFLISDEPYRELVYSDEKVPYVTKYYKNSFVVYSFSKSLSLPGERIGYVVIPHEMDDFENIFNALVISNRILGFVNAPSLMQKVIKECLDEKIDISYYKKNRDLLFSSLTELGFECIKPAGAFYLFVKSPTEDDLEFVKLAKKYNILFVPGTSFCCKGYVRIAYCVSYETIENSLDSWRKLASEYDLK